VMLKNKIKGITCLWKQNMTFVPCNFETQKFLVMENCVRLKKSITDCFSICQIYCLLVLLINKRLHISVFKILFLLFPSFKNQCLLTSSTFGYFVMFPEVGLWFGFSFTYMLL
jgi:hypothetical protein